jgi:hypothetical protein
MLKPMVFDEYEPTTQYEQYLNDLYPNNSVTFFYFGTRAENKFYHYASGSPLNDSGYTRITSGLTCLETCACSNTAVTNSNCVTIYPTSGESSNCSCCSRERAVGTSSGWSWRLTVGINSQFNMGNYICRVCSRDFVLITINSMHPNPLWFVHGSVPPVYFCEQRQETSRFKYYCGGIGSVFCSCCPHPNIISEVTADFHFK